MGISSKSTGETIPMSRILITGAAGFIGSRLISTLRGRHELFALVQSRTQRANLIGVEWVEHDLSKPLDDARLPDRMDAIIHLAQSRYYRNFPEGSRDIFDVNIRSTFQLLEYARRVGVEYFLFASSGGVYGYSYKKFVEGDPVNPLNFYLSSKYTAELLLANYQPYFKTVVFRFFFVYGPGQNAMLIPDLISKVMKGELITIEGNPGLRINPIYIEDALRVFEPALNLSTSALFNVAGDQIVTVTELVKLVGTVSGKPALIQHKGQNPIGDLIGDNTRLKETLGVAPKMSLREGLRRML
jgi:nucleoside-diphosphate-sugar epimerase